MTAINFVGLGAIGLPMAIQLARAGHDVTGVDPIPAARDRAESEGITAVASISDAGAADLAIAMVATPDQLEVLITQAADSVAGQTWVIMSTVGPEALVAQSKRLQAAGATIVDGPVTGGVARASIGDLVIFASGDPDLIAEVSPVLSVLGTVRIVGTRLGDGQSIKVVNQHLASVHIVAAAEALSLARSLGLDEAAVLDLVGPGAAGSWMLSDRGPRMLLGTDAPVMSTINIFVKDSGLVSSAAAAVNADVPLLKAAQERYLAAEAAGLGLRDDSRVIETYQA
ncbi:MULTISPECIES: NAD(P)-dependent oxidoreductase [unclassified Diaminobutyricimonas]|uniref:NAD(P)-dependent oxidoreductase n=1 Tax=unclassified Diaminobutyricimonas TaxID=2643261 RepID=UPI0012F4F805|nr:MULTISPECIES: NAD(P)-dependent oxidoreductase [unclassified Diaminobutyricimonas]